MWHKLKIPSILCACVLLLCLSGCASISPSVDELLRAPILSGEYNDIRSALIEHFDDSVQLKYPTEGELLSPFALGDWNGDGVEDAVVLFTLDESSFVFVGVLNKDEADAWQVAGVATGLSDTVVMLEFAAMQADDTQQIVVTFQAQGEKYLAVYAFQEGWLSTVFQQPCSQYLIEDITGTGTDNLILITTDEAGMLQMELLTFTEDGFTQGVIPSFNEVPFTGYANIIASEAISGRQYLMIDGFVGEGQTTLATEMLWYNSATGSFAQTTLSGTKDLYNDSKRYLIDLISCDIDGDGAVEIPVQYGVEEGGTLNHVQNRPVSLIVWQDFTRYDTEKSFGIYDDEYNYYLALSDELKGNLLVVDGDDGDTIEVRNLAGDVLYFALRVVDFDEQDDDWLQIVSVASKQIQVKIGDNASSFLSVYTLSRSIYLL